MKNTNYDLIEQDILSDLARLQELLQFVRSKMANGTRGSAPLPETTIRPNAVQRPRDKWVAPIDNVLSAASGYVSVPNITDALGRTVPDLPAQIGNIIRRCLRRHGKAMGWTHKSDGKFVLWRKEAAREPRG